MFRNSFKTTNQLFQILLTYSYRPIEQSSKDSLQLINCKRHFFVCVELRKRSYSILNARCKAFQKQLWYPR